MPRNPRRVAFNFQKRSKKREARPNVYAGPVPETGATVDPGAAERGAVRDEAAAGRLASRRAGGRGRARSVIYTEFLRQELLKFGAVTLVLVAVVIVAAIFYK
jgi:hypothetical protein